VSLTSSAATAATAKRSAERIIRLLRSRRRAADRSSGDNIAFLQAFDDFVIFIVGDANMNLHRLQFDSSTCRIVCADQVRRPVGRQFATLTSTTRTSWSTSKAAAAKSTATTTSSAPDARDALQLGLGRGSRPEGQNGDGGDDQAPKRHG
jgi:hypothetical protein